MRILHIFRGFHDYLSGLLNGQADLADVHVLSAQRDEAFTSKLSSRIKVHRTRMPAVRSPLNAVRLPALRSMIRQIDPDVIHLQSGLIWECGAAFSGRTCPVILTVHDIVNHPATSWLPRPPAFLTWKAAGRADAVIVHGESLRQEALKHFRPKNNSDCVFAVDHPVIARYGTGAARPLVPSTGGNVLFFGFLQKNKGLEYLVQAETMLRQRIPNVSVVVAGASSDPSYYQKLFANVPGISLRLGHQDEASVTQLFRWADVIVLPYIEASQSGVLQVATSFGLPPVATNVGGLKDAISDRVNGVLVQPRDASSLALGIQELLTNSSLRERVIRQLQMDRDNRFSWETVGSRTTEIYREVISRYEMRTQAYPQRADPQAAAGTESTI